MPRIAALTLCALAAIVAWATPAPTRGKEKLEVMKNKLLAVFKKWGKRRPGKCVQPSANV